jgi:hypothetical protein
MVLAPVAQRLGTHRGRNGQTPIQFPKRLTKRCYVREFHGMADWVFCIAESAITASATLALSLFAYTRRRARSRSSTRAAFRPEAPMIPPPGCVLAPQM